MHDTNLTLSGILVIVFSLTMHGCVEKYWKEHSANHFPFFILFLFARALRTQIRKDMWRQTEGYLG